MRSHWKSRKFTVHAERQRTMCCQLYSTVQILQLLHLIWLLILTVLAMQTLFPSTAGRGQSVYDTGFKSTEISALVLGLKKAQDSYHLRAASNNICNGKPRADLGNVFGLPGLHKRWWGLSQQVEMNTCSQQSCTPIKTHISDHYSQSHPFSSLTALTHQTASSKEENITYWVRKKEGDWSLQVLVKMTPRKWELVTWALVIRDSKLMWYDSLKMPLIVLMQLSPELEINLLLWCLVSTEAIFENRSIRKERSDLLACCWALLQQLTQNKTHSRAAGDWVCTWNKTWNQCVLK